MSRLLLICCALLSCFSSRLQSRTVSPIDYEYADVPRNAYGSGYGGGGSGYGGGVTGYARRGYAAGSAPASYGYGHRSMPDPDPKIRQGRDNEQQSHAMYESPNTYEYMKSPGSKSERTRVPKTEKRPPGDDDVELIGDGAPAVSHNKDHRRQNGERSRDFRDGNSGSKKKKRKTASTSAAARGMSGGVGGNYGDGGAGYSVSEPEAESASSKNPAEKRTRKKKNSGGGGGGGGTAKAGKSGKDVDGATDVAVDPNVPMSKQKVHKKNEYSEKQEFFDEEHVNNPVKTTAAASAAENGGGRKKTQKKQRTQPPSAQHHNQKQQQQQRQQQQQKQQYYQQQKQQQHQHNQPYGAATDMSKRLVNTQNKVLLQPPVQQAMQARPRSFTGYGQIIALR